MRFSPAGVKDSALAAILRPLIKELCASVQMLSVRNVCLYFHLLHTTDNDNAAYNQLILYGVQSEWDKHTGWHFPTACQRLKMDFKRVVINSVNSCKINSGTRRMLLAYNEQTIRAVALPQILRRALIGYLCIFPLDQGEIRHPLWAWAEQPADVDHTPARIHPSSFSNTAAWGLLACTYWFWRITRDKPLQREVFLALQRQRDAAECKSLNMIHSKPGSVFPVITSWRHGTLLSDRSLLNIKSVQV